MSLNGKHIRGVLLDITGVLIESSSVPGVCEAIPGSVEAVQRLISAGISVRFVTNETQRTRKSLVDKLHSYGFSMPTEDIFPPALAMASLAKKKNLKPFLLVHDNCLPDLADIEQGNVSNANSVILGDAVDEFSYSNMNKAFRILMKTGGDLYSLGKGKYYRDDGELTMDVGPFTAALEFATDKSAIVVGKPAKEFFQTALDDMGVSAEEAVMVGDDIVSDVGGAQNCGIQGVLVRTGKYRPCDENHPKVKPDQIVDKLADVVAIILS